MPLTHVEPLDPTQFTVAPHVCAVDTFRMKNADGTFVADVTDEFIDKLVDHMNERERLTGDLSPIVIGHTIDGQPETEAPPVVGYARNWHSGTLGTTGRKAAFFDAWIFNDDVPLARKFPRRSCEVWTNRFEVDPISLLGATTPARDLGLMRLSRDGAFTVESPGDMQMPVETKPEDKTADKPKDDGKPKADPKETGKAVHDDSKLDAILSGIQQLISALTGGTAAPDASGKDGAAPGGDEMTDEEFNKLLAEAGQPADDSGTAGPGDATPPEDDKTSRAGEQPVKNSGGNPGGMNTHVGEYQVRLSRLESENEAMRVQLSRSAVEKELTKLRDAGKDVDPTDEALIADLIAMPVDMRSRQLDRIAKLSRPRLDAQSLLADSAVREALPTAGPRKVMRTADERNEIMRLARERGKSYEAVLREEGYLS